MKISQVGNKDNACVCAVHTRIWHSILKKTEHRSNKRKFCIELYCRALQCPSHDATSCLPFPCKLMFLYLIPVLLLNILVCKLPWHSWHCKNMVYNICSYHLGLTEDSERRQLQRNGVSSFVHFNSIFPKRLFRVADFAIRGSKWGNVTQRHSSWHSLMPCFLWHIARKRNLFYRPGTVATELLKGHPVPTATHRSTDQALRRQASLDCFLNLFQLKQQIPRDTSVLGSPCRCKWPPGGLPLTCTSQAEEPSRNDFLISPETNWFTISIFC